MNHFRYKFLLVVLLAGGSLFFLKGDFCSDIFGLPLNFQQPQTVDLQVNLADLGLIPQVRQTRDDLGDLDIPEDLTDFDINWEDIEIPEDILENLEDILSELDVDLDGIIGGQIPLCSTINPGQGEPGDNCLCRKDNSGTVPQVVVPRGCVLGQMDLDILSQDAEIKKFQQYIKGIYLRKLSYRVRAQDLPLDLPNLRVDLTQLQANDDGTTITLTPLPDTTHKLGVTDPITAGYRNVVLFSDTFTNLPQEVQQSCLDAVDSCDQDVLEQCNGNLPPAAQLQCVEDDLRFKISINNLGYIANIMESLRFRVTVTVTDDIDLTEQFARLIVSPRLQLNMRVLFDLAVIVVPKV